MHRTKLVTSLATATALVAASGAMAASSSAPATSADLQLKGAYAFQETFAPANRPYIVVVYRTAGALPRRYDGMVRAGGSLDGTGGSTGGVPGKKGSAVNHCYSIAAKVSYGRIAGAGTTAKLGSKHTFTVSARDADGNEISDSIQVKVAKRKVGDRSGKPLGC